MNISDDQRKWWVSIAANLMLLMLALDITIVNLALPAIAHTFNATMSTLEWVINAYIVTFAMLLVTGGRLGDIFGHRRVLVIGLTIFIIASLSGGFSHNITILIISRVLQGIGAAISFPASSVINFAIFPKHQKAIAMGITATIAGAGQALGPSIGGIILKFISWPWIFFVNIPIGIFAITLLLLICPKYVLPLKKQKINYLASLLLALGIFSLIFGLIESQNWHVVSVKFATCIGISIVFFASFYFNSKHSKYPLFDLEVFRNKMFLVANIARMAMAFCTFVILFAVVLYMQNIAGITPLAAGYLLLCMTVAWAGASPLIGIVIGNLKNGARTVLLTGTIFLAVAFLLFSQVSSTPAFFGLAIIFLCSGLGVAMLFTSTNTLALTSVAEHQLSSANSLIYLSALSFNMVGVAISGSALTNLSSAYLVKQLLVNNIHLAKNSLFSLIQISEGSYALTKLSVFFDANMAAKLRPLAEKSFLHAFSLIMWCCFALLVIVFAIVAYYLKSPAVSAEKKLD
jgi:EmrB/QacA subfamily drug resistance transporter